MTAGVGGKILVVDDNPGTLYATTRVLRAAGFNVVEATNGQEALADAPNVDLVVLDINLPDIDGYEVCRQLRASTQTARTPVIHLSATFVQEEDKIRGLSSGADGYLTHPVEGPVLVATINAFLRARQAEDAMRESEAKFRAIFDQSPHGIALVSQDFVYLEVNHAMCHILGRPREQIVGKHHSAFTLAGREGEVIAIASELTAQSIWRGTSSLVRADSSHAELEWTVASFNIPGVYLAMVTDITSRRSAENERERLLVSERAARTEAERANRLKDDFLATLSHELRTPLNAIVGWAQILRSGNASSEDMDEGLEVIDRNIRAQSQLIADLLDVSRITSGKLRLELEQVDAPSIVNAALNSVAAAAAAKQITLRTVLSPGPSITADPSRLQQIVWNLVTNSVKFTPAGGIVEIALKYSATTIELVVSDNGQGISPEFLPHIFERFSQADPSSRRVHGGLGIGLAIVKNLAEMHGGHVAAASEGVNKGARFTVSLPLAFSQPVQEVTPALNAIRNEDSPINFDGAELHGVRVLVIEDDADARRVLIRILKDLDAVVADANSVPAALEVIPQFRPNVLVCDIGMPGQNGYDLVRLIRKRTDAFAMMPAIALTAFAGTENANRALREGFQAHLAKPVNPMLLVLEIKKLVIPKPSSSREAPDTHTAHK